MGGDGERSGRNWEGMGTEMKGQGSGRTRKDETGMVGKEMWMVGVRAGRGRYEGTRVKENLNVAVYVSMLFRLDSWDGRKS